MKRNLLIFIMLLTIVGFSRAQVISDFEVIHMNLMVGGATDLSNITVVPNPDPTGINTSNWVAKLVRDKDGVSWCGFWSPLTDSVDVTDNKYVHVKVWKPRISPIKFKLEGGPAGNLEDTAMIHQSTIGAWEDIVFNFSSKTGKYHIIAFMPDFAEPVGLTEDIVIYFDDIVVNNDPTPNSAAAYVIEDYELIKLNLMGDPPNQGEMTVIGNPDPAGINLSNYVVKFVRPKNGVAWAGFWSLLPEPIDVTTNKYMHVKVWKPLISPIKFKIEGGASGDSEIESTGPQTSTGVWEDMVFDYTTKTGTYPKIAFMPDFADPVGLTEDITIYFDDIILNNDPNPISPPVNVTLNVNMSYWIDLGKLNPATGFVDVAGNFNGWNPAAGTYHFTTTNDSIYTLTLENLTVGDNLEFKYRINGSWADSTSEFPGGGPNRTYTVVPGENVYNGWYNNDSVSSVTFEVNMYNFELLGKFHPTTDFVDIAGSLNNWDGTNYHLITEDDSIYYIMVDSLKFGSIVEFKYRINGSWADSTCEFPAGGPNRKYTVPAGPSVFSAWYNNQGVGISENSLAGYVQTYPNPVKDVLNVTTSIELNKVVITNTVGQVVYSQDAVGVGRKAINVSDLSTGMYFITFYGKSGGQYTQKVLKY